MRIAICDDDKQEIEQTVEALRGWDPSRQAECFTSGKDLLVAAEMKEPFSIAFLDIYMPGEDGMEIAKNLKKISPETGIVFVTTSQEHAVDAFSLHSLHYLVKPVTTEGIVESFRRLTKLHSVERRVIRITSGQATYAVYVDEICYLQSYNHMTEISLLNGELIRSRATMGELEGELGEGFLRLNRSTLVNMSHIRQMGTEFCLMSDGVQFELPRRERTNIRNAYSDYLFSKLKKSSGSF